MCNAKVVSVRYRPIGENKQQDKMTTAQIFIPTTNNQFQRCVYKSYIKWLGMLSPGCGPIGSMRERTSSYFNGSEVSSDCIVGALLQPRTGLSYGADGKGLPGPIG